MKRSIINLIFIILISLILIGIVKYPKLSLNSAYDGLNIWFNVVIPSLLPFFIVSEILIGMGFVNFIGELLEPLIKPLFNVPGAGAFSFSMSIMSGYPMGSKIVSNLRENNLISKIEGERMLSFSSTSGPLFMIGAVSIGMLNNPSLIPLIIYPHYFGAITMGLIFRFYKNNNSISLADRKNRKTKKNKHLSLSLEKNISIGSILSNSVKNSMNTIGLIGGFMIFYSVLTSLIFASKSFNLLINYITNTIPIKINIELLKGFLAGMLEITTGCKMISHLNIDLIYKVLVINFLIGWSGLSIHSQALSFISKTDIDSKIYLWTKFFHGIFSSFYGFLLYILKYKNIIRPSFMPSFTIPGYTYYLRWPILFTNSFKLAIFVTAHMLISSLIMLIIYYFFSRD